MFRIEMLVLILSITNISLLLPQTKLKIVQCLILKHPDAYRCRNAVLNHRQWLGTIPPMTHTNVKMSVVCRNVTCNHFISDLAEEQPWTGWETQTFRRQDNCSGTENWSQATCVTAWTEAGLKYLFFVATNMAGICPEASLKISHGFTLTLHTYKC